MEHEHLAALETTLVVLDAEAVHEETLLLRVETSSSRIRIAEAARTTLRHNGHAVTPPRHVRVDGGGIAHELAVDVVADDEVIAEKVVALYTARDRAIFEPGFDAGQALEAAGTFDELLATHTRDELFTLPAVCPTTPISSATSVWRWPTTSGATTRPPAMRTSLHNNAYTNVMAAWLPRRARALPAVLSPGRWAELSDTLALRRDELERWDEISRKLVIPFHSDGAISQFEGYEDLAELPWDDLRDRHGKLDRPCRLSRPPAHPARLRRPRAGRERTGRTGADPRRVQGSHG